MPQDVYEQLHFISEKIEEERNSIMCALLAALTGQSVDESRETDKAAQTKHEKVAMLTLCAIRIQIFLALMERDGKKYTEDLLEDWREVVDCVRHLSYAWRVTDEVLSDAVDLVLLFNPSVRSSLLGNLGKEIVPRIKSRFPLCDEVFFITEDMIRYCLSHELTERAEAAAYNLVSLSRERNRHALGSHRETVVQAMWYLVNVNAELTARIGMEQLDCFEGKTDSDSAHFFWFLAIAWDRLERPEKAAPFFARCSEQYLLLEGERSWVAAKAAALYHYYLLDTNEDASAEAFLWQFLRNIDNGYYTNVGADTDDVVAYFAAYTRYVLLAVRMERNSLRGLLPEIERLADYCKKNASTTDNPRLTMRAVENILSGYYLGLGEHLQAAMHATNALNAIPPNNMERIPSDDIIYSNLLQIYSQLNDADKMEELYHKMLACADRFADDKKQYYRICILIETAANKLGITPDKNRIDELRRTVFDFYREMEQKTRAYEQTGQRDTSYGFYILSCISNILDVSCEDRSALHCYREITTHMLKHPAVYAFYDAQKVVVYLVQADVLWHLNDAHAIDAVQKCLHYCKALDPSQEALVSTLRLAAVILNSMGRPDLALPVVYDTLSCITSSWHKAVSFLNDHRVCQAMSNIQLYFNVCYAILKKNVDIGNRYYQVLRFKSLPALVGRERNRILRLQPVDEQLKKRIFSLQDQLATVQLDDALQGRNRTDAVIEELKQLEAQFAAKFPQNIQFTEISLNRIAECLKEHEAIVEYFFSCSDNTILDPSGSDPRLDLEIFIVRKEHGRCSLFHLLDPNGNQILEKAISFIDILQSRDDAHSGDKAVLRAELYRELVAPLLPYLSNIECLYLAPDLDLCNLPFEILYADDARSLSEQYRICRLVCGRDLLFFQDGESNASSSFVLGYPDYDGAPRQRSDPQRACEEEELAAPLPFSAMEVRAVGALCRCTAYTGRRATKHALRQALPCRIIHLATHGVFDESMESDSLYSSALLFAGYNDWLRNGSVSAQFGNGTLTADEISRMDLRETELVVLSACQSGLGDTSFGGTMGLLSAFSAAGARWVVCHMWKADDYVSAVFMAAFYQAYLIRKQSVPDALQAAKNYVRNVTVGELRRHGWLRVPPDIQLSENGRRYMNRLIAANDFRKPFRDESLWGGFVCYKCK